MPETRYGFIGLGNMGAAMCGRLIDAGFAMTVFDAAGTAARAPKGATIADDVAGVAAAADRVFLSLPDGNAVAAVAAEITAAQPRRTTVVADFSTTGPDAAAAAGAQLAEAGVTFIDAPVSGGRAGALAGTLTVMCSGDGGTIAALDAAFKVVGRNVFAVGARPGQAQAMKLLNNFLSATAMAATSEAVTFGAAHGLAMDSMLAVLNVSTGRNSATADKFPNRVATGAYDAGFTTALMTKDVALYLDQVRRAGTRHDVAERIAALWRETDAALPGSDFTEIYRHVAGAAAPPLDR
jgi:3-hydroxyisobutyrate dehydrogenase